MNQKFTGKERDQETGLDYFGARYYGGALGRFTSPDWSAKPQPVPYADFSNPQSLNLYAYVQNNPLKNRDLDGHICIFGIGNTCTQPAPPRPPKPPAAPQNGAYGTVDQAGVAAAKADKRQTDARRPNPVEYGNSVYKINVPADVYSYTDPVTSGKRDTVNPNRTTALDSAPIPDGTTQVGEAHSHSDAYFINGQQASPRDQLSFQDRNRTINYPDYQKQFQAMYVALPDGTVIKYTPQDQTTVLH